MKYPTVNSLKSSNPHSKSYFTETAFEECDSVHNMDPICSYITVNTNMREFNDHVSCTVQLAHTVNDEHCFFHDHELSLECPLSSTGSMTRAVSVRSYSLMGVNCIHVAMNIAVCINGLNVR